MPDFQDLSFESEDFCGTARLFPLPNLVMFPHVLQPLHLFEPRYRELFEETIDEDHLIAMSLLQPGWEEDYEGRPPLWPTACLGRVASYSRLDDGTYNVLLLGLRRLRLIEELPIDASFRRARAEILDDQVPAEAAAEHNALRRELREQFLGAVPLTTEFHEQLEHVLGGQASLGMLTDVISFMLDLPLEEKMSLLAEVDVGARARRLITHLAPSAAESWVDANDLDVFPPKFSAN